MCLLEPFPEGRERRPLDEMGGKVLETEWGISYQQQLQGTRSGPVSDKLEMENRVARDVEEASMVEGTLRHNVYSGGG